MITDDIRARRERVVLDHFADEVAQDWDATLSTFPHPHHEIVPLGPVPATGSAFKVRMTAFFVFDEDERLACERIYFDQATMVRQLLGGIDLRSPRGVLTLVRALIGLARMAGQPRSTIPEVPARVTGPARPL